nr:unconventional myosin-Ib-like [Paramormyrops kingsleyae]XP_023673527.1 unconventional myosin-Ib-like [Paramormyrops kingsleyae]
MSKMEAKTSLLDNMIGVGDMVLLEPLTEESFINNLKNRFEHGEIYTYIGSVVISLNPYKPLPIYTADKVEEYRNRNFYELSPHIPQGPTEGPRFCSLPAPCLTVHMFLLLKTRIRKRCFTAKCHCFAIDHLFHYHIQRCTSAHTAVLLLKLVTN